MEYGTLDRRLRHFEISYHDYTVSIDQVQEAVREELKGPGKLLGYRAMQQKIRKIHDLCVPRDLVYDQDPDALERRAPGFKAKDKENFTMCGPNWVCTQYDKLDGHDKLMGYQNSTFPSQYMAVWIHAVVKLCGLTKVWVNNSDPKLIGRFYLDNIYENKTIASRLRVDKGFRNMH